MCRNRKTARYYEENSATLEAKEKADKSRSSYLRSRFNSFSGNVGSFVVNALKVIGWLCLAGLVFFVGWFLVQTIHAYIGNDESANIWFNVMQFATSLLSIAIGVLGLYMSYRSSSEATLLWRKKENAYVSSTDSDLGSGLYPENAK